ncbi:Thioredoxin [uncultured archaeon]|nr:Thioredoxin [uncultured archaeon]
MASVKLYGPKQLFGAISVFFIISFLASSAFAYYNCVDSDNGKNLLEKGTTTGYDVYGSKPNETKTYTDYCAGTNMVMEFSCETLSDPHPGYGYVTATNTFCPTGMICTDAKCVPMNSGSTGADTNETDSNRNNTAPTSTDTTPSPASPNQASVVSENVTCIFSGSNEAQACKTSPDSAAQGSCTGVGSCVAAVSGPNNGSRLVWNGTCGWNLTTALDGQDEKAIFNCQVTTTEPETVTEQVNCAFSGEGTERMCWSEYGSCYAPSQAGESSCTVDIKAKKGATVYWKSSCGGNDYKTPVDGIDNTLKFSCAATPPTATANTTATPSTPGTKPAVCSQRTGKLNIEYFVDFNDKFSRLFETVSIKPLLEQEYPGKLEYTIRHMPVRQDNTANNPSQKASEAVECARAQNMLWQYVDVLFDNPKDTDTATLNFSASDLKYFALRMGMDTQKFNDCLDTGAMAPKVNADMAEAIARGATGTPTFFIGSQIIRGAQPIEEFRKVINSEFAGCNVPVPATATAPAEASVEQVKCLFMDGNSYSAVQQKCWSDYGFCAGVGACVVDVKGPQGAKANWKSSCGGNSQTVFDGQSEYAKFECSGSSATSGGSSTTTSAAASPMAVSNTSVADIPTQALVCTEGDSKSFECSDTKKVSWCSCIGGQWRCAEAPERQCAGGGNTGCNGCISKDRACVPAGTRIAGYTGDGDVPASVYCDFDGKIKPQKLDRGACQNSYECVSNTCSSGTCVNLSQQLAEQRNILEQILAVLQMAMQWVTHLLGGGAATPSPSPSAPS